MRPVEYYGWWSSRRAYPAFESELREGVCVGGNLWEEVEVELDGWIEVEVGEEMEV